MAKYEARIMYATPTPGLAEVEPSTLYNPSVVSGVGVVQDPAELYGDMHKYLAAEGEGAPCTRLWHHLCNLGNLCCIELGAWCLRAHCGSCMCACTNAWQPVESCRRHQRWRLCRDRVDSAPTTYHIRSCRRRLYLQHLLSARQSQDESGSCLASFTRLLNLLPT